MTGTGLSTVSIEWDEGVGNKDFYYIYATDVTNPNDPGDRIRNGPVYSPVDDGQQGPLMFDVEGLIPNSVYLIEVEAVSGTLADHTSSEPQDANTADSRTRKYA